MKTTTWQGCYAGGWRSVIVDDAFGHPAKFARGLIRRIYSHLCDEYGLPRGSLIVDPFGGVALGAVDAMANGYQWLGVELEPRFHDIGNANLDKWRLFYPDGVARLVLGDSRELRVVLEETSPDVCVASPPFLESLNSGKLSEQQLYEMASRGHKPSASGQDAEYGQTHGQLAAMKPGDVSAVLGSPPYENGVVHDGNGIDATKLTGNEPGANSQASAEGYGTSPGQLGSMKAGSVGDVVVSSPPFEDSLQSHDVDFENRRQEARGRNIKGIGHVGSLAAYGDTPGNIGNDKGDTFWSAAKMIVAECYEILRPGGMAVWVCKDFIKAGKRVPFSADWRRLCESVGFETVEWVKASLVKVDIHPGLFGEDVVKTTVRKSFFRRLCESKGSPPIDEEDVLFMRKELTT